MLIRQGLAAALAVGLGGAGFAQGAMLKDALIELVDDNGLIGTDVRFDLNDLSISTFLSGAAPAAPGDIVEGIFTIETISLVNDMGSFVDEIDLSMTDIEVFGRFRLEVGSAALPLISMSSATFEIFEDDRADGVRSVAGLTGSMGYNSPIWGGGGGIANGSMFGMLDLSLGGTYDLFVLPNGDLAVLPMLDVATVGLPLNDPSLNASGPVSGTGTVSPTAVAGEFNNRASFSFAANVVPEPASAALVALGVLLAMKRPRSV
ncbi:hypothetical protein [Mucisphaera sp.]|uniref:hypothetical protein n=1 Tax=Mucisphaera sp. TaxID=2913024 RepID=UPI003D0CA01C